MPLFRRFLTDERGATAIEYGVLAAILAVAVVAGFSLFASSLSAVLGSVVESVRAAIG